MHLIEIISQDWALFFSFTDRPYCDLSFKNLYEKRLILSKVINEKRFFALRTSNWQLSKGCHEKYIKK